MISRELRLIGFVAGAVALGCAGAAPRPIPPVPPETRAAQAALGERVQALEALVTELAPTSGPDGPGDLSREQADRFAAAWKDLLDTGAATAAAFDAYEPNAGKRVQAWLGQYVRRAGAAAPRAVPAGAEARPVASTALFNLLAFRQRQAEVEARRGLLQIWWDAFGPDTGTLRRFTPGPCPDGTRAQAPDANWAAGCRFLFRLEVPQGGQAGGEVAVARGVSSPVEGVELRLALGARLSLPFRAEGREPKMFAVPGWPAPDDGEGLYPAVRDVAAQDFGPPEVAFGPGEAIPTGMTRPVRLFGPDPAYTRAALQARVQGRMIVLCVIAADGWLYDCRVVKGLPLMNQGVLDVLAARRYQPVTFHGKAIDCDYVFNIDMVIPAHR